MSTAPIAPRVRFAPSPTGYLHVGGARTALFNWFYARANGGKFILRIEDTDAARNTPEAMTAITDGLRWLGVDWDEGPDAGGDCGPYLQSQRKEIYDRRLAELTAAGHTYTEENGAVRFRSPRETVVLADKICGDISIDRSQEPDMTLRRPDGSYIFHFVNVVDDLEMGITHVIRGEDHIYNTGKHIELFRALGAEPPVYAHIPLILNQDGSKMSKRDQGASMSYYQENGYLPAALSNYLCLLGWSPKDDREILTKEDVIPLFRWDHMGKSNAKFDLEKCRWMNGQYLAQQPVADWIAAARVWISTRPELPRPAQDAALDALLVLIQPKVRVLSEAAEHLQMVCQGDAPVDAAALAKVRGQAETPARLTALAGHLESVTGWQADAIQQAIQAAAAALQVKPGALLFPLRVAITGQGHGVDLLPALELLGQEEVLRRLQSRTALFAATE